MRRRIFLPKRHYWDNSCGAVKKVVWKNFYFNQIQASVEKIKGSSNVAAKGMDVNCSTLWTSEPKGLDQVEMLYRGMMLNKVVIYFDVGEFSTSFATDISHMHVNYTENNVMPYVFNVAYSDPPSDYNCTEQYWRGHNMGGVKYLTRNKIRRHRMTYYLKPSQVYWSSDGKFENEKFLDILKGQGSDKRSCISKYCIISPLINENVDNSTYVMNLSVRMRCYYYMTFVGRKFAPPNVTFRDKNNKAVYYDSEVKAGGINMNQ